MARGKASFTQSDVRRLLAGAKAAGVPVKLEYADGKIVVRELASNVLDSVVETATDKPDNPWDTI